MGRFNTPSLTQRIRRVCDAEPLVSVRMAALACVGNGRPISRVRCRRRHGRRTCWAGSAICKTVIDSDGADDRKPDPTSTEGFGAGPGETSGHDARSALCQT